MKLLIVCSGNYSQISPFIKEQAEAIEKRGVEIDYFLIKGKGLIGYLKNLSSLKKTIREFLPEIIHAHYGLSGLLACLQRKVPVVITFHGCDINRIKLRALSYLASCLSRKNIFVSENLLKRLGLKKNNKNFVIPCGVNHKLFFPTPKENARKKLGLEITKKYILFSSGFDNKIKNYQFCYQTLVKLNNNVELIELSNRTRNEVYFLMYACDLLMMTSFSEGSPQVIKEALISGLPIISTNVGDVKFMIDDVEGCYIIGTSVKDFADRILQMIKLDKKTEGRERIIASGLDSESIAKKIIEVYSLV